ncbi:glutamate racemase [Aestuariispira insulae]|uniref:Glutamate racemase n=1 Tax=Aestuariispira insulae TaxID=1461337 RepID=A0A3D9HV81_9PROT|nr:aspartate/glutamate racemase family protein [Aestuariispira insulae]RED53424.1 glutamate racemase [Aestuariispira insulae]
MIGVFDSGSGGMTVLDKLRETFPGQSFIYLGDHRHAPYGKRTAKELYELCCRNVSYLMQRGCRLVVLACNTASVSVLRRMQREWLPRHFPDHRILGVFVPMVEFLTGWDWRSDKASGQGLQGRVTLFATPFTVHSKRFSTEIRKRSESLSVMETACPALVRAIEDHACQDVLDILVENYVRRSGLRPETNGKHYALLGCTHYPLLAACFRRHLPSGCRLLSQPDVVAKSLMEYASRHPDIIADEGMGGEDLLLTTGDPDKVSRTVSRFLDYQVRFEAV